MNGERPVEPPVDRSVERQDEREIERDSQLSAMFDGELPGVECELIARRLSRDEALRSEWSRYSMIGAASGFLPRLTSVERKLPPIVLRSTSNILRSPHPSAAALTDGSFQREISSKPISQN